MAVGAVGFALASTRKHAPAATAASVTEVSQTPAAADQLPSLVINALSNAVIVVNRSEQVILANPAARSMGLLNADRLDFDELTQLVRDCMIGARSSTGLIDLPLDRLGREPIALSVTAVPLPDAQAPERVAAVALLLDDVSETRRLEDVRRDFVANVSHELKTPVGALTLLAEAVQEAADDPEAVQRFAGRMQHEGARLGRLVRELIELSRLQGAEPLPGGDCVDITDVLDEAQDRTRLVADQAGIEVISRSVGDLKVRGNEGQLTTAVANLVDNAIAYSPRGTRVALSARLGRDAEAKPCVEISVSDQGIGLAESDLARVFERFYRVDPARSRATGGTGLGLAIVKHVATNHGGTISVWSVEGAGSTFTIRLPTLQDSGEPAVDSINTEQMTKGSV
ncbi:two-component system sensor histidine kinase SenX3 [Jatrophihabitans sp. GAS493]|uniref:sensor histidine kinase n=1 Tax=Jatrophihabitans sp. GAS493 TaxID=1907575 RepID=UPI000BC0D11B|nr:ATP-binding protein [Jatrophihabitans sp. GAS493]SOD70679.1 two-component system sensor histidine kinase SenX3 [Jatrophihabitans sp. GAS493]